MSRLVRVLAILGGTFDPIHYGHLRLAADVKTALSLPEVRLIPAGIPPHRARPIASAEDRFAMTALGCAEFAGLSADAREIGRAGPSYTVQTLEELHAEQPALPLALLIGADAFAEIHTWKRWRDVVRAVEFIVVSRPRGKYEVPKEARVRRLDDLEVPTSSSEIRRKSGTNFRL